MFFENKSLLAMRAHHQGIKEILNRHGIKIGEEEAPQDSPSEAELNDYFRRLMRFYEGCLDTTSDQISLTDSDMDNLTGELQSIAIQQQVRIEQLCEQGSIRELKNSYPGLPLLTSGIFRKRIDTIPDDVSIQKWMRASRRFIPLYTTVATLRQELSRLEVNRSALALEELMLEAMYRNRVLNQISGLQIYKRFLHEAVMYTLYPRTYSFERWFGSRSLRVGSDLFVVLCTHDSVFREAVLNLQQDVT